MTGVSVISPLTIDCIFSEFDNFPKIGEEKYCKSFDLTLGGGPVVIPLRLQSMGIPSRLGTFVGSGMLSEISKSLLNKENFNNTYNFYNGQEEPVIISSVFSFTNDRSFLTFDANLGENTLTNDEIYAFLKGSKIAYAPNRFEVIKKLKKDGTLTVFDVHWDEKQKISSFLETLSLVDFFTPNDKEAMFLTETTSPNDAILSLKEITSQPIVKLGKDGCLAIINGEIVHIPSFKSGLAVDSTGAGDNFLAGLIFGLYQSLPITKCIELANIAGSISTTKRGCFGAKYDLNEFIR